MWFWNYFSARKKNYAALEFSMLTFKMAGLWKWVFWKLSSLSEVDFSLHAIFRFSIAKKLGLETQLWIFYVCCVAPKKDWLGSFSIAFFSFSATIHWDHDQGKLSPKLKLLVLVMRLFWFEGVIWDIFWGVQEFIFTFSHGY